MAASRDASGKFIKGSGAPGWTPEATKETEGAAKGAGKAEGAWSKAGAAAKALAGKGLGALTSGTKALTPALKGLGGAVTMLSKGDLPNAASAMKSLGSAIGGTVVSGAEKLSTALKGLGPEGAAAGAAIEILAGAFSALFGSMMTIMGLAIEITQKIDLMRDRFAALAGSVSGGKAVQGMLSKLSASLPFASSQVSEWGQQLLAAGIKGQQLEADIKAVAAATALMGESGGAAAMTLFKRLGEGGPAADSLLKTFQKGGPKADKLLKEMGLSIKDIGGKAALSKMNAAKLHEELAKAMAKKGAGPLKDLALTLPIILQKAREGFNSLFAKLGPAVKPFMTAVKNLFANFNKGTPVIKMLQGVVTKVFTVLFGWATKAVGALQAIFKWFMNSGKAGGMLSGAVKAARATWATLLVVFKTVGTALSPVIALFKGLMKNAMVMKGIKAIFTGIAIAIGVVVVIVATLIAVFATVAGFVVGAIGLIIGAAVGLVGEIVSVVSSIIDSLSGLGSGASGAASGFISGLLGGIKGGAGAIISAVKGIASSALGAFKGMLGIASPSKVMAKMGGHFTTGAAQGMDAGVPKVEASAARVGNAASDSAGGAMKSGGGAKGGKTITVHVEAGAIVIHAGGADIDETKLAIAFERALATQGL